MELHTLPGVTDLPFNLPAMTPEELHRMALKAFRLRNRADHKFNLVLLAISLGPYAALAPTFRAYVKKHFHMSKTQMKESLRIARMLLKLPRTAKAYDAGEITWSHIMSLTRVAEPDTEEAWLDFARKHTVERVRMEVQSAEESGDPDKKKLPREDRLGLPPVQVPVSVKVSLPEYEFLQKVFLKIRIEMQGALGPEGEEAEIDLRQVLLYMSQRLYETDPEGKILGREEREDECALIGIQYQVCPSCEASHVRTPHGLAEVPLEQVLRVLSRAERTLITPEENEEVKGEPLVDEKDRPTPPSMLKKLLARDDHRCQNPHCGRRLGLHGHHVVFRSRGGRTCLHNLVSVCLRCHASIHAGVLEVYRDASGDLRWVSRADAVKLDTKLEAEELGKVPLVVLPERLLNEVEGMGGAQGVALPAASPAPPAQPAIEESAAPSCFEEPARAAPASPAVGESRPEAAPVLPSSQESMVRHRTTGEVTRPAGSSSPAAPVPPIPPKVLDDAARGLHGLGYDRKDARERVLSAWRALQERGRRFGMEALLGLAIGFRACLEGESPA